MFKPVLFLSLCVLVMAYPQSPDDSDTSSKSRVARQSQTMGTFKDGIGSGISGISAAAMAAQHGMDAMIAIPKLMPAAVQDGASMAGGFAGGSGGGMMGRKRRSAQNKADEEDIPEEKNQLNFN